MISFGKNPFHTLFSSSLKGTLNVAIDIQALQLVCIQLVHLKEQVSEQKQCFPTTQNPRLILLATSNTTSPSVINLTLVLRLQINYKVTSIIQNFYPLSSYLLQSGYLQMQLSDPGYPLSLSHSQQFGLHGCSLQVTITTFCRLYACQERLAKGMDKVKKPANINQTDLNIFLYLS